MSFLGNIGILLAGFVVIIAVFIIILAVIERKLKIRIVQTKFTPNQLYLNKISVLDVKKPGESLKALDKLAKAFFREAFKINSAGADYSELFQFFNKKNNKKAKEFCSEMNKFLYSNEEISKKDLQYLIRLLAEIIASNRIFTKEEREELNKKAIEKNPKKPSTIKKLEEKIPFFGKKK